MILECRHGHSHHPHHKRTLFRPVSSPVKNGDKPPPQDFVDMKNATQQKMQDSLHPDSLLFPPPDNLDPRVLVMAALRRMEHEKPTG